MANTINTATRTQKIDFINAYITRGGKKISKTELKGYSDVKLDSICEQFAESFEDYLKNPPVKLQKFYVECLASNKRVIYEVEATDVKACEDDFKEDDVTIVKIVPVKGHHICKYCGHIAEGTNKDILCDDCKRIFGHYLYSEL